MTSLAMAANGTVTHPTPQPYSITVKSLELAHLRSCERYDEPETLPSSICLICPTSADGGHPAQAWASARGRACVYGNPQTRSQPSRRAPSPRTDKKEQGRK